jgi:hypothetical protein
MKYLDTLKGVNLHVPSLLLGGAAGLIAGGGTAYLVCRHAGELHVRHRVDLEAAQIRDEYQDRLDAEVAAVKAQYNDRLKDQLSGAVSSLPTDGVPYVGVRYDGGILAGDPSDDFLREAAVGTSAAAEIVVDSFRITDPEEGLYGDSDDGGDATEEADGQGSDEAVRDDEPDGVARDIRRPYIISLDEYGESPPEWQQLTLIYFAADKVLVDDKNEPIQPGQVQKIVGPFRGVKDFGGISQDPHLCYIRNQELEIDFEILLDRRSYVDAILNYGNPTRRS